MNESAAEPRTYLVGLPVAVTVYDDGTVIYEVDTAEAAVAIGDADWPADADEENLEADIEQMMADQKIIEADHERRRQALQEGPA